MLLSRNYPPSPELEPYIVRHYVFAAELPEDLTLEDRLLSETAFVRILIRGDWQAEIAPGYWAGAGPVVFFGPNELPLRVRVKGPFTVAGFAIHPGGWKSLFDRSARDYADQMIPLAAAWGNIADRLWAEAQNETDDARLIAAMEHAILARLAWIGVRAPDTRMNEFAEIARADSTIRIDDAAAKIGLSVRQLERRCLATFGLSPKAVLRRSRFLDMATAMRGFSSPSEEELAALRYFDQSHLTREFKRFAGMTPRAFERTTTPLFTAGLNLRSQAFARSTADFRLKDGMPR
ncbi:helix-turn-helix transcriptional regulator [Aquisediminimonas profunda]|uniref:helix-turn-helix transcriptional regulator n=1 Tax=Aquisediminimonas profunda TaxID=1550733 RepID=UPI001C631E5A|nr:helix-turn-helix domain-containing protein [Aquisediminimonas profunda]